MNSPEGIENFEDRSMEMIMSQTVNQYQAPIWEMQGIELFNRFTRDTEFGSYDLHDDAEQIMKRALSRGFAMIAASGPNGSGKGGLLKGFKTIFENHPVFQEELQKQGKTLDVIPVPFALCAEAAKLPDTPEKFAIEPTKPPYLYNAADTDKISNYQRHLIDRYIVPQIGDPKKVVVGLVESSTPLIVPALDEDVKKDQWYGYANLGVSTFFSLAWDLNFRDNTNFYLLNSAESRALDYYARPFRELVAGSEFQHQVFEGSDKIVFTDNQGKKVKATNLTIDIQQRIWAFIKKTQAPPKAMDNNEDALARFKNFLRGKGLVDDDKNESFYKLIGKQLGFADTLGNFTILSSGFTAEDKTDDIDYFLHSLPVRIHGDALTSPLRTTDYFSKSI